MTDSASATASGTTAGGVVILYKPKASPDADLALSLESELRKHGHSVFMDRRTSVGLSWARELEGELQRADLVVALISVASAESELLAYELEVAMQVAQKRGGFPRLMPVRVFYKGPLSDALGSIVRPLEFEWDAEEERHISRLVMWNSPSDDRQLADHLRMRLLELRAERSSGAAQPAPSSLPVAAMLEPLGGAVPLDSKFYIERSTDDEFLTAVRRQDSLVLVKGGRQMGKTSLLARGMHLAREAGCKVVVTDLQRLQSAHFQSGLVFYRALAELVAEQLDLSVPESVRWERNPNVAFEHFWVSEVLAKARRPVVWAVDEFDRLFVSGLGGEVCGLLRSWHNARALDPALPWRNLTVTIAYATEAHLFINDLNQSPFNVGTRLALVDFTTGEVAELNERHGRPVEGPGDLDRLIRLLGGHPYLVRCALHEMTARHRGVGLIEELAEAEETVFGEHLRRLLFSVGADPAIFEAMKAWLFQSTPLPADVFYRLRSAGVILGASPSEAHLRCGLYERFLRRHLA